jgi:hypothetical protein
MHTCCVAVRSGKLTDEVYGQDIMFVANDWHAALLPVLLTARFRWGSNSGTSGAWQPLQLSRFVIL